MLESSSAIPAWSKDLSLLKHGFLVYVPYVSCEKESDICQLWFIPLSFGFDIQLDQRC